MLFTTTEGSGAPADGRADFDFLAGCWTVAHRRLRERLTGCDH
jgi:hypothetical protein